MTDTLGTVVNRVVLVVEDEPLVLMLAIDLVEEAGFEVAIATNAAEAIAILEARDIATLFTDIDMRPGMDGMELAALVQNRWPDISIIVASGYHLKDEVKLPGDISFFQKPYVIDEVVRTLRNVTR